MVYQFAVLINENNSTITILLWFQYRIINYIQIFITITNQINIKKLCKKSDDIKILSYLHKTVVTFTEEKSSKVCAINCV